MVFIETVNKNSAHRKKTCAPSAVIDDSPMAEAVELRPLKTKKAARQVKTGWCFGKNEAGSLIMVDSSVWIDYLNGQRAWQTHLVENLLSDVALIMGGLIPAEA